MLPSLLLRKVLESGQYTAYLKDSSSNTFLCNVVSSYVWEMALKIQDAEEANRLRKTGAQLREEIQNMLDRYALDPEWIGTTLAGAMRCRDEVKGRYGGIYSPSMHNPKLRKRALKVWRDFADELEERGM